jgi:hypothetical protein
MEVVTLRSGAPNFRKIRYGITSIAKSVESGHVTNGVAVMDSVEDTAIRPGANLAAENGLGFVWFRAGRFIGTSLARDFVPWLIDQTLDITPAT